jgi:peptidoglycan hydrolase-like amidase
MAMRGSNYKEIPGHYYPGASLSHGAGQNGPNSGIR